MSVEIVKKNKRGSERSAIGKLASVIYFFLYWKRVREIFLPLDKTFIIINILFQLCAYSGPMCGKRSHNLKRSAIWY